MKKTLAITFPMFAALASVSSIGGLPSQDSKVAAIQKDFKNGKAPTADQLRRFAWSNCVGHMAAKDDFTTFRNGLTYSFSETGDSGSWKNDGESGTAGKIYSLQPTELVQSDVRTQDWDPRFNSAVVTPDLRLIVESSAACGRNRKCVAYDANDDTHLLLERAVSSKARSEGAYVIEYIVCD